MNKSAKLRETIRAALKRLDRYDNPDRLHVLVTEGSAHCTLTESLAFEYRYTVELILTDYAGDIDDIMAPLLDWARLWEPALFSNPDGVQGLSFEAEILGEGQVDLSIKIRLSERCAVERLPDGGHRVTHLDTAPAPWMVPQVGAPFQTIESQGDA